ncbi:hypothetical protein ElyMa_003880200 [Elysia marginata]|uniref:Uncharacterized protein n=1 Tax=Elysia marginata TaxID=1093978 RepID=A0AAV4FMJ6_9GAST|nr:hypothetical protein ElyMa_003880200 [Elysia marginata]
MAATECKSKWVDVVSGIFFFVYIDKSMYVFVFLSLFSGSENSTQNYRSCLQAIDFKEGVRRQEFSNLILNRLRNEMTHSQQMWSSGTKILGKLGVSMATPVNSQNKKGPRRWLHFDYFSLGISYLRPTTIILNYLYPEIVT